MCHCGSGALDCSPDALREPDLQGIWSNRIVTPLERPKEFGTRQFLTEDEIAAEERQLREQSKGLGVIVCNADSERPSLNTARSFVQLNGR